MKKLNLGLTIAAGLLGGVFCHYIWTQPVQAQNQTPTPLRLSLAKILSARDFNRIQGCRPQGKRDAIAVSRQNAVRLQNECLGAKLDSD
ncbi:MAG: hypothetical protein DMG30_22185 [Acidobacteria bacterium]|nr:MAG: hypothetical protein DMG30_22185 [Acidobacteriota bacterium]